MIKATFYKSGGCFRGFEISGHSGYGEEGNDIICASVSSAAYMTVNTITDVIGQEAEITVEDGYMKVVTNSDSAEIQMLYKGFLLHVKSLAEDYKGYIFCRQKLVKE